MLGELQQSTVSCRQRLESEPTRPMLVRLARQYRRPLITFYLAAPPRQGERGTDFRTLPSERSAERDALGDGVVRGIRSRQSMVWAPLEEEG